MLAWHRTTHSLHNCNRRGHTPSPTHSLVLFCHPQLPRPRHHQALQEEGLHMRGREGRGSNRMSEVAVVCQPSRSSAGNVAKSWQQCGKIAAAPANGCCTCVASTTGLSAALLKSRMATEQPGRSTRCSSCGPRLAGVDTRLSLVGASAQPQQHGFVCSAATTFQPAALPSQCHTLTRSAAGMEATLPRPYPMVAAPKQPSPNRRPIASPCGRDGDGRALHWRASKPT